MDAAPPEAAEPQETAEPRKRTWWRVKFPTSVVVTLVGIALTAWLLPAFTRQWEERHKAQELRSRIVADMASATSRALAGADGLWSEFRTPSPKEPAGAKTRFADDWSVSSLQIEARLRAYFPADVVAAWQLYSWFVDRFTKGQRAQAQAALFSAVKKLDSSKGAAAHTIRLDPAAAEKVSYLLAWKPHVPSGPSFAGVPPLGREYRALERLRQSLGPQYPRAVKALQGLGAPYGYSSLVSALLDFQEEINAEVLASHPTGYSTTGRDLIHDLLPF